MVITKKIDYRKRKKRETFFGIPYLPLIIFLALIIVLLALPSTQMQKSNSVDFGNFKSSITGHVVVSNISLSEIFYNPNEALEGNLKLKFGYGDKIPPDTNVTFVLSSIKCKNYYVCEDGRFIVWERYNSSSGQCEEVSDWFEGPWEECGESYSIYNCTENNKICCSGNGIGYFYDNLDCTGNQECWEECKRTSKKTLIQTIALSTTPWKGNYSEGIFNNIDGPNPIGSGYGFGGCGDVGPSPEGQGGGFVTYAVPIVKPDLVVSNVYIFEVGGSRAFPTLYATVSNQAGGDSGSFSVVACIIEEAPNQPLTGDAIIQPQVPDNCFDPVSVLELPAYQAYIVNFGSQDVVGKTIEVTADYFEDVTESNENNNKKQETFEEEPSVQECYDSDVNQQYPDGKNYYEKGTCTYNAGGMSIAVDDECTGLMNVLKEYYCNAENECEPIFQNCNDLNNKICLTGICVSEVQPKKKPDLIVYSVKRQDPGIEIIMKNIGQGTTAGPRSFSVKVTYRGDVEWMDEIIINNPGEGYGPNAQIPLYVFDPNLIGKSVTVEVFVDSGNHIEEENENNNEKEVWLSPYSCDNWLNKYIVSLSSLGVSSLEYEGGYNLKAELNYNGVNLDSYSTTFIVEKERTRKACSGDDCISVSCEPDDPCIDTCSNDDDCEDPNACEEFWRYRDLSKCENGIKKIECFDDSNCGTIDNKPTACVLVGDLYIKEESCCSSNWQCSEWSVCYEFDGDMIQSVVCEDLEACDIDYISYTQLRDCCEEEWSCKWSSCINGEQEKICKEVNNCDTEFTKPDEETRACVGIQIAWWVWLIVGVVLVAIALIVFVGTKFKKPKKSKLVETKTEITKPKIYPGLTIYINKAIEKGMSKQVIKTKLLKKGWPADIVNEALK